MTAKIFIALLFSIILLSGGIVLAQNYNQSKTEDRTTEHKFPFPMKDYHNQLKMEDRPSDWQPPFPDEDFSFSRFENTTEFNDYLEYRFPVGTPRPEIERVLVRIGGADSRMHLTPEMIDNKQHAVTYNKWTWQRLLGRLMLSPNREAFVTVYYDRHSKLIKSFGEAP